MKVWNTMKYVKTMVREYATADFVVRTDKLGIDILIRKKSVFS